MPKPRKSLSRTVFEECVTMEKDFDVKEMLLAEIGDFGLAEDAAVKTKHRFKAGDSVQLPIKHWTKSLPGEMGDVREVDEEKGVYLVEFDETGITDPIPFACLDEHGIRYIDGTPVEDAAAKRTVEFHVSRNDDKFIFDPLDFDQNPFEWGAIYHINKIRDAVAQKKDGITAVELKELLEPFYKAAEERAEEYGRNKEWVKKTVLGVPKALEDAFADITNGEGAMGKQYFLDHLTVEAICALAAGDIDGICEAVDYYDKKGRYSGKDTTYHVGDYVIVPATGGGHEIRRIVAFADDAKKCWLKNVGRGRLRQFECKGLGKRYDTYDSAKAHMETLFPEERQEMILPVTVEDASESTHAEDDAPKVPGSNGPMSAGDVQKNIKSALNKAANAAGKGSVGGGDIQKGPDLPSIAGYKPKKPSPVDDLEAHDKQYHHGHYQGTVPCKPRNYWKESGFDVAGYDLKTSGFKTPKDFNYLGDDEDKEEEEEKDEKSESTAGEPHDTESEASDESDAGGEPSLGETAGVEEEGEDEPPAEESVGAESVKIGGAAVQVGPEGAKALEALKEATNDPELAAKANEELERLASQLTEGSVNRGDVPEGAITDEQYEKLKDSDPVKEFKEKLKDFLKEASQAGRNLDFADWVKGSMEERVLNEAVKELNDSGKAKIADRIEEVDAELPEPDTVEAAEEEVSSSKPVPERWVPIEGVSQSDARATAYKELAERFGRSIDAIKRNVSDEEFNRILKEKIHFANVRNRWSKTDGNISPERKELRQVASDRMEKVEKKSHRDILIDEIKSLLDNDKVPEAQKAALERILERLENTHESDASVEKSIDKYRTLYDKYGYEELLGGEGSGSGEAKYEDYLEDGDENHKKGDVVASDGKYKDWQMNIDDLPDQTERNGSITRAAEVKDKIAAEIAKKGYPITPENVSETNYISTSDFTYKFPSDLKVTPAIINDLKQEILREFPADEDKTVSINYNNRKGTLTVTVENDERGFISHKRLLQSKEFQDAVKRGELAVAIGLDDKGKPIIGNLTDYIHVLLAGTTGSGKSARLNSIITSLLMQSPDNFRMILIDPKRVEFSKYKKDPHLLGNVVTEGHDAIKKLNYLVNEQENRYRLLEKAGVSNITEYNEKGAQGKLPEGLPTHLPAIGLFIDEFGNLMGSHGKEIESLVKQLGEKSRAAGVHLVLATQRPTKINIPTDIRANIPTTIGLNTRDWREAGYVGVAGLEDLPQKGPLIIKTPDGKEIKGDGSFINGDSIASVVSKGADVAKTVAPDGNGGDTVVPEMPESAAKNEREEKWLAQHEADVKKGIPKIVKKNGRSAELLKQHIQNLGMEVKEKDLGDGTVQITAKAKVDATSANPDAGSETAASETGAEQAAGAAASAAQKQDSNADTREHKIENTAAFRILVQEPIDILNKAAAEFQKNGKWEVVPDSKEEKIVREALGDKCETGVDFRRDAEGNRREVVILKPKEGWNETLSAQLNAKEKHKQEIIADDKKSAALKTVSPTPTTPTRAPETEGSSSPTELTNSVQETAQQGAESESAPTATVGAPPSGENSESRDTGATISRPKSDGDDSSANQKTEQEVSAGTLGSGEGENSESSSPQGQEELSAYEQWEKSFSDDRAGQMAKIDAIEKAAKKELEAKFTQKGIPPALFARQKEWRDLVADMNDQRAEVDARFAAQPEAQEEEQPETPTNEVKPEGGAASTEETEATLPEKFTEGLSSADADYVNEAFEDYQDAMERITDGRKRGAKKRISADEARKMRQKALEAFNKALGSVGKPAYDPYAANAEATTPPAKPPKPPTTTTPPPDDGTPPPDDGTTPPEGGDGTPPKDGGNNGTPPKDGGNENLPKGDGNNDSPTAPTPSPTDKTPPQSGNGAQQIALIPPEEYGAIENADAAAWQKEVADYQAEHKDGSSLAIPSYDNKTLIFTGADAERVAKAFGGEVVDKNGIKVFQIPNTSEAAQKLYKEVGKFALPQRGSPINGTPTRPGGAGEESATQQPANEQQPAGIAAEPVEQEQQQEADATQQEQPAASGPASLKNLSSEDQADFKKYAKKDKTLKRLNKELKDVIKEHGADSEQAATLRDKMNQKIQALHDKFIAKKKSEGASSSRAVSEEPDLSHPSEIGVTPAAEPPTGQTPQAVEQQEIKQEPIGTTPKVVSEQPATEQPVVGENQKDVGKPDEDTKSEAGSKTQQPAVNPAAEEAMKNDKVIQSLEKKLSEAIAEHGEDSSQAKKARQQLDAKKADFASKFEEAQSENQGVDDGKKAKKRKSEDEKKPKKNRLQATSRKSYDDSPESGSNGLYSRGLGLSLPIDHERTKPGGKVYLKTDDAEWTDWINNLLDGYGGLTMSKGGKIRLGGKLGVPKELRSIFGNQFFEGQNDGINETLANELGNNEFRTMSPQQIYDALQKDKANYQAWKEHENKRLNGETSGTLADAQIAEHYAAQEDAEKANTVEVGGEPYLLDDLEEKSDKSFDEAFAEVNKAEGDTETFRTFSPDAMKSLKWGDTIRFADSPAEWEVLGYDPESNTLRIMLASPEFDTGKGVMVEYEVSPDGFVPVASKQKEGGTDNGRETQEGAAENLPGNENGKGDAGKGTVQENSPGAPKDLELESSTIEEINKENKDQRDREEIKKRKDAPLKTGKGDLGQGLLDLGGGEGQRDLFNQSEGAAKQEPNETTKALEGLSREQKLTLLTNSLENNLGRTLPEGIAENFLNAIEGKDSKKLQDMLTKRESGPAKAAFEAVTGVKLPKLAKNVGKAIKEFCGESSPEKKPEKQPAKSGAEKGTSAKIEQEKAETPSKKETKKVHAETEEAASAVAPEDKEASAQSNSEKTDAAQESDTESEFSPTEEDVQKAEKDTEKQFAEKTQKLKELSRIEDPDVEKFISEVEENEGFFNKGEPVSVKEGSKEEKALKEYLDAYGSEYSKSKNPDGSVSYTVKPEEDLSTSKQVAEAIGGSASAESMKETIAALKGLAKYEPELKKALSAYESAEKEFGFDDPRTVEARKGLLKDYSSAQKEYANEIEKLQNQIKDAERDADSGGNKKEIERLKEQLKQAKAKAPKGTIGSEGAEKDESKPAEPKKRGRRKKEESQAEKEAAKRLAPYKVERLKVPEYSELYKSNGDGTSTRIAFADLPKATQEKLVKITNALNAAYHKKFDDVEHTEAEVKNFLSDFYEANGLGTFTTWRDEGQRNAVKNPQPTAQTAPAQPRPAHPAGMNTQEKEDEAKKSERAKRLAEAQAAGSNRDTLNAASRQYLEKLASKVDSPAVKTLGSLKVPEKPSADSVKELNKTLAAVNKELQGATSDYYTQSEGESEIERLQSQIAEAEKERANKVAEIENKTNSTLQNLDEKIKDAKSDDAKAELRKKRNAAQQDRKKRIADINSQYDAKNDELGDKLEKAKSSAPTKEARAKAEEAQKARYQQAGAQMTAINKAIDTLLRSKAVKDGGYEFREIKDAQGHRIGLRVLGYQDAEGKFQKAEDEMPETFGGSFSDDEWTEIEDMFITTATTPTPDHEEGVVSPAESVFSESYSEDDFLRDVMGD